MKRNAAKRSKTIAISIVVLAIVACVLGFYAYLSNRNQRTEEDVPATIVDTVLLQDIERNYPPTPKEVLKYYSEITTCFYNEEYTEEQLGQLAKRARELYDAELVADMSDEEYLESLKQDILEFDSKNIVISHYSVSASTDVDYFTQDGYSCARLYASYRLRQGTEYVYTNEVFVMRRDDEGHWKIFGFDIADEIENTETMEETRVEISEE